MRRFLINIIYLQGFFDYPKATETFCIINNWVFHIGFNLMYVALVVKTWRYITKFYLTIPNL